MLLVVTQLWKRSQFQKIIQLVENTIWLISGEYVIYFQNAIPLEKMIFWGYMQRRLDYISVSNTLQEWLQQTCILPYFCSDHSPILVLYSKSTQKSLGKNLGKFNRSLVQDKKFVLKLKEHIKHV